MWLQPCVCGDSPLLPVICVGVEWLVGLGVVVGGCDIVRVVRVVRVCGVGGGGDGGGGNGGGGGGGGGCV